MGSEKEQGPGHVKAMSNICAFIFSEMGKFTEFGVAKWNNPYNWKG